MNKEKILNLSIIIAALLIIIYLIYSKYNSIYNNQQLYQYKNPSNMTIVSPYSIEQLSYIPIEPNISLYNIEKNYKYYLFIFDPTLSGYYNAEIAYIYIKIPYLIPVCSYYYQGCKYFLENNSINSNNILVYSPSNYSYNYTYILPENQTLLIYIVPTNNSYGINIDNNSIYIMNNNSIIAEEIASKFILYWYGIINN